MPRSIIGTRGSPLAMLQAAWVRDRLLETQADLDVELLPITTTAEERAETPLTKIGGIGLFVNEIEAALIDGRIDIAVHSAKDVPTRLASGLAVGAFTEREQVHDVYVGPGASLDDLPRGTRIGTSSLRRRAQLLSLRPDLTVVDVRGNVQTRLRRLTTGAVDGLVLAAAGLNRLGRPDLASFSFDLDDVTPAVGQGALAVEVRVKDRATAALAARIADPTATLCIRAERESMRLLGGGCQLPLGILAQVRDRQLYVRGFVGLPDGTRAIRAHVAGPVASPESVGRLLAEKLCDRGALAVLASLRTSTGVGPAILDSL